MAQAPPVNSVNSLGQDPLIQNRTCIGPGERETASIAKHVLLCRCRPWRWTLSGGC